ncbi:aminotransferase class I/II-fold pyridoxal phosphate-dependent enzyme [Herbiconiux sp. L3-i23]|uniref:aminotransferase class I/II-fold pyridoxal phosphate-dependent enzyme n=1 Tax=Herbiconiux sp. L3-i23 TaxID=2905871 RepID=UPI00207403BA|nr:aminotransferase class I/II-fold pyridoxal phosphate-dependent enzyme [Herbiconiux sp. L3-i23]
MTVHGSWERAARGALLLDPDGSARTTIFAEMSALAARTGAINLGQGFPDYPGPAEVLEVAQREIAAGNNQYPPGRGIASLREAISEHQRRFYGLEFDADREVLVTAGATEALAATILALIDDGDEVVTFEPFYDEYGACIGLARGVHKTVPLAAPDFQPDLDRLRATVTDKTRLIVVNTPHNPTGAVFSREVLETIVDLAERHDAYIVTDEVYEHLHYDGSVHVPIATLPGARERTITISSGGKTFNTTGWKIGWLTAPAPLVDAVLAVKQFLTYVNGSPFQPAIAAGLSLPDEFFASLASDLAGKRDLLAGGLRAAGFGVTLPRAGYFIVADARPLGFTDGADLCRRLPELAGVVGVPISAFCLPENADQYSPLVRFAFCKRLDVLEEASQRLASLTP